MHTSVLLQEVLDGLSLKGGETVLDATLGGAGHSEKICALLGGTGRLLAIEADRGLAEAAKQRLAGSPCKTEIAVGNFRDLDTLLTEAHATGLNGALFDLGISSMHLETLGRGFSFKKDEPLRMTLGEYTEGDLSAHDVVNMWSEETLADVIYGFGGERFARRIARAIVEARKAALIESSLDLSRIIESVVPRGKGRIDPATKTFQAIRIATNDEIGSLKEALPKVWKLLLPQARLAVISFHELEDRTVKQFFKEKKELGEGLLITKKPIVPTDEEIKDNPRSRSAKLRIIEKI